jgi:chemotaxis signal transduction protein
MSAENTIQTLLVPLRAENLLIPQVMVAEILSRTQIIELAGPDWLLGMFVWRDQQLPLISFEQFCKSDSDEYPVDASHQRIAVIHGIHQIPGVTEYGVEINAIPHPLRIAEDEIEAEPDALACELLAQAVNMGGVKAAIPNFSLIERRLAELLQNLH